MFEIVIKEIRENRSVGVPDGSKVPTETVVVYTQMINDLDLRSVVTAVNQPNHKPCPQFRE